jgi:hypothetical protein
MSFFVVEVDNEGFKVYDSAGNLIDPAKDSSVQSLLTTLNAIKDTDGIKKITDALPTGDNWIGKTKVGDGTNVADVLDSGGVKRLRVEASQPAGELHNVVLYDSAGHPVGVVLDGAVYRIQADAKVAKGASDLVHLEALDTVSGMGRLKATIYTPDDDAVSFTAVPPNPASIRNDFVREPGDSANLLVDGDPTPVVFTYDADVTYDISIQEVKFVLVSNSITFGSNYFGATVGPLANGLLVEIISDGNTGTLGNIQQNEDFVNFASPGGFDWVVSSKDMIYATYLIGGGLKLKANTTDKVRVTVRDDIDAAGVYLQCFVKGNLLGV